MDKHIKSIYYNVLDRYTGYKVCIFKNDLCIYHPKSLIIWRWKCNSWSFTTDLYIK